MATNKEMKVYLLIRRTKKYYETGEMDIPPEITYKSQLIERLKSWPFGMDYMEFRSRLRKISESSLKGFDEIIPWANIEKVRSLENGWLLPIDEDDWLAPDIADRIRSFRFEQSKLGWRVYRFEADGRVVYNPFIESCGCAFGLPTKLENEILNHMEIANNLVTMNDVLSVRNETISSLSYMGARYYATFEESIKKSLSSSPFGLPEIFKPQYEMYMNLLSEVNDLPRRKNAS